ncbi:MAG: DUF1801 domain-containing protein [Candidatus Nitrosotenuis sp.]
MRKAPQDVDAYIAASPKEVRGQLKELRSIIKKTAPRAAERISYSMPFYEYGGTGYKGRLAYFAAFKKHVSLFLPPPVVEEHQKELRDYKTTKSAIHFPLGKPLPTTLIRKLIQARMKKNDERKN